MKKLAILVSILCLPLAARAAAYGSLNNFDVVNDTGHTNYGFEIELDDLHSTDITYTYDWNHYGVPKITEDKTDPAHPKVYVRYESKRDTNGVIVAGSWTNPQDPLHPLGPTGGHAFTDPSVNLGGEHFGVGFARPASLVKYNWLMADPANPAALVLGPAVNVATPSFVYVPAAPAVPAQIQVVIVPPAPEVPEINSVPQFGVPVWVKVLKTIQPSGKHVNLDELLPNDPDFPNTNNWAGAEPPQTEVEWQVFQLRPTNNPAGPGEIAAHDDLPNGDETVTRRYEFYVYQGPVNPDDGEAQCSDTNACPGSIGAFIGAQMAGFNVVTPLGLIGHLQDGELSVPYVDRSLAVGGTEPYAVAIIAGALPDGLGLNPTNGVLSGTPTVAGQFALTVKATDADAASVTNVYSLKVTAAAAPPLVDTNAPSVSITSPTSSPAFITTNASFSLSGTATDNVAVVSVNWTNSAGGSGIAVGTASWTASGIVLHSGLNALTVTAFDAANNAGIATLAVTYAPPPPPDTNAPSVSITSPTSNPSFATANATLALSGTATDNVAVVNVTWTNSAGGSGIAVGTSSWTASGIVLHSGLNLLTVTAFDAANNAGTATLAVTANFITNPFIAAKGVYHGLFYQTNGFELASSGAFAISLTSGGTFSGSVQADGVSDPFSGKFDPSGAARVSIARRGKSALVMNLQLDLSDLSEGASQLTGTISDGTWTAWLSGDRALFNARTFPAPQAGRYTLVVPGAQAALPGLKRLPNSLSEPQGYGYAVVSVSKGGLATLTGTLADGQAISQTATISKDGDWPLYLRLYRNQGCLAGWLRFTNLLSDDLTGELNWLKPNLLAVGPQVPNWLKPYFPTLNYYPRGFTMRTIVLGSRYSPPDRGQRVLNFTNALLTLDLDDGSVAITNRLTLDGRNRVRNQSANPLSLGITTSTGRFTGWVVDPNTSRRTSFNGVLLQKRQAGFGSFLEAAQSGEVHFGPNPPALSDD